MSEKNTSRRLVGARERTSAVDFGGRIYGHSLMG